MRYFVVSDDDNGFPVLSRGSIFHMFRCFSTVTSAISGIRHYYNRRPTFENALQQWIHPERAFRLYLAFHHGAANGAHIKNFASPIYLVVLPRTQTLKFVILR